MSFGAFGVAANPGNPNKDIEVPSPPSDGISSLSWSPTANIFVAGSWDNQVRCWEVQGNGVVPKAAMSYDAPVLCTAFSGDGTRVFSGGCDKMAKMWPLGGGTPVQVAQHDQPVKCTHWVEEKQILVTGSWDKTMKFWDMRQAQPAATVQMPERVYAMDCTFPLLVVATAERHVLIYDLTAGANEYRRMVSPLKYQSRCLACFPDKTGFALGSIEGRCAIQHVQPKDQNNNFAFKCHRENNDVYAVNSISFHPVYGTFATAGADGTFNFWDKDSKQRLKQFAKCPDPIPTSSFNRDGSIYAYAMSYDWSKGHEFYNPATSKNIIFLHAVQEVEIKGRARGKK